MHPRLELAAVGCMDGTFSLLNTQSGKVLWTQRVESEQKVRR